MTTEQKEKWNLKNLKPIIGLALVSLLICGILFPLLITGISQVLFPYQANGEIVQLHGQAIGSNLIAQNFTLPIFFHTRDQSQTLRFHIAVRGHQPGKRKLVMLVGIQGSASGVDPDITLQEAYSQIPGISDATGIPADLLRNIVNQNQEGTLWVFGSPYVNVLRVNLALINTNASCYKDFH
ncbi:MAG: potassium-transporting ATPase subunit C [Candidatus Bathyarchaeia archaeon]|jgi:K+-transporting ATPase ATPase C chain